MPKHIVRLVLLIIGFGVLALAAKSFFTVDSFYRFGHYRADSVSEIAALTPAFQTPKACRACHAARHAEWASADHKAVICETCHGAAPGHPDSLKATIPTDTPRLCTQCHETMPGRPTSSIRQIDPREHYASATQCIGCHNPHAPKIAAPGTRPAFDRNAAVASAAVCAGCHGPGGIAANEAWPNLAGQNAAYIARSLGAFKTGARKEATMSPMAQSVADEDVQNLAAYFNSLSCSGSSGRRGSGNAAAGKALAGQCTACHGEAGRPVNTSWPKLVGQNPAYLVTALTAFRDGQRSDPFMSPVARTLSDTDIANLATHFAALSCGATPK